MAVQGAPSWFFAPLGGGEESGLNEPGLEAFKRAESLARETCQNILDHPDGSGQPRIAVFEYLDLPAREFPDREHFEGAFRACRDHVLRHLPQGAGKEERFFEQGLRLLAGDSIPTLRIGDENTTGLVGDDDDRGQPFWRLLKGQGYSSLQGVGGGTYGIGQRAPFARSDLRTVIYATRLPDGGEAFVAKTILASHPSPLRDGEMVQSKGWYCIPPSRERGEWAAIRAPAAIPGRYRRQVVGTDLYVVGYTEAAWDRTIRDSVLQNFFCAIDRGSLEVRICKNGSVLDVINRANLEEKLIAAAEVARRDQPKAEFRQGLGSTIYFLKALRNPLNSEPFTKHVEGLGTLRLYVHRDARDPDVPERWAAMRRPLMVVEQNGSGLLSRFAAVLTCEDESGNQFLARMEDPRHSRWHEEEMRNATPDERKYGRNARLAISRFVSETLKRLRGEGMSDVQDIPFLGRYLPLDAEPEDELAPVIGTQPTGGQAEEETGHRTTVPATGTIKGTARPSRRSRLRVAFSADHHGGGQEIDEPDDSDPEELGGGRGTGDGDSPGTGGRADGGSEEGAGPAQGTGHRALTSADVRFRSYVLSGGYRLVLESKSDVEGDLELRAVGEDSTYPLRLTSAVDAGNGQALTISGPVIKAIRLAAGAPRQIDIEIDAPFMICLGMRR